MPAENFGSWLLWVRLAPFRVDDQRELLLLGLLDEEAKLDK